MASVTPDIRLLQFAVQHGIQFLFKLITELSQITHNEFCQQIILLVHEFQDKLSFCIVFSAQSELTVMMFQHIYSSLTG